MSASVAQRRDLPPFFAGLANLLYGLFGGLALLTVPQLLAARGIAQPLISSITATVMIPTFCGFLLAPILDVRFSRRTYALTLGTTASVLAFAATLNIASPWVLTPLLTLGCLSASLYLNAIGGWLGSVIPAGQESRLAAGFTIGNIGGFGVGAILFITIIRALPGVTGAALIAGIIASPMLLFCWIAPSPADRRGARENFAALGRDLRALMRQPVVLRTLFLFCLPAASFALTNTLGGLGTVYATSERAVGLIAGVGVTAAGIVGSLLVPALIDRIRPLLLYLAIGATGAVFTLALIGLPHTPAIFALALIGQNVFQSAAFAVEGTIVFRSLGDDNPIAATQFAFLQAGTALPVTYMQAIDGQAYGFGGLTGMLATDGLLSLLAVAILLPLVVRWHRRDRVAGADPVPLATSKLDRAGASHY